MNKGYEGISENLVSEMQVPFKELWCIQSRTLETLTLISGILHWSLHLWPLEVTPMTIGISFLNIMTGPGIEDAFLTMFLKRIFFIVSNITKQYIFYQCLQCILLWNDLWGPSWFAQKSEIFLWALLLQHSKKINMKYLHYHHVSVHVHLQLPYK